MQIVLTSSALGMGVNFPDVRYVIHLGPASSMVDHVQQSGHAGHDGKQAYNVILTTGHKLAHCEADVKTFAKANDCLQKALMKPLDVPVDCVLPLHNCCSNCKQICKCDGQDCSCTDLPFTNSDKVSQPRAARVIPKDDESVLEEALKEFQSFLNTGTTTLLGSTHAFTDKLVKEIISNAPSIFNLDDVLSTLSVFATAYAVFFLGSFNIFLETLFTMKMTTTLLLHWIV